MVYEVNEEIIADVVAMMTGIPVNKIASRNRKVPRMDKILTGSSSGRKRQLKSWLRRSAGRGRAQDPRRPIIVHLPVRPAPLDRDGHTPKYLFETDEVDPTICRSHGKSACALVGAPRYVGYERAPVNAPQTLLRSCSMKSRRRTRMCSTSCRCSTTVAHRQPGRRVVISRTRY